jgi:hypothetical protein
MKLLKQYQEFLRCPGIKITRWLICEQEWRSAHEGTSYANPLAFAP